MQISAKICLSGVVEQNRSISAMMPAIGLREYRNHIAVEPTIG
jgi:hypothetical protein